MSNYKAHPTLNRTTDNISNSRKNCIIQKTHIIMSPSLFMRIADTINQATTIEAMFNATMAASPIKMGSYHHFPSIGAFDYNSRGRFFTHKMPSLLENHYKKFNPRPTDPGLIATFEKGQFMWLSDLAIDPLVVQSGYQNHAGILMNMTGDGLCIPLFGPSNRRGFMFISGNLSKAEAGHVFPYQVQSLAQLFHIRFCQMIHKLQKKVQLTSREAEVLELVAFGKTNQDIADILNISASTVSGYLTAIFLKLDVSDRVSASMRAQSMKVAF